jgi:hypothetical protein
MASKRDELAKRFSDRLQKAPPRGQAMPKDAGPVQTPTRRGHPSIGAATVAPRLTRGSAGTALRGHLVPHSLHADARRAKLAMQSRRGQRITWTDVATEAIELLLAQRGEVSKRLADVRRLHANAVTGPRLVQATIPLEHDRALAELRLDLADELGHDVPYEQLWAAGLLMWVRHAR